MGNFCWFFSIGIIMGFIQSTFGDRIYEFHPDPGEAKRKELEEKKKILKEAPLSWKIERWLHRFLGVFIGWMIVWVLLDQRINIFSGSPNFSQMGVTDLVLFILGWIGINGRLPTIAHDVQNWFRR